MTQNNNLNVTLSNLKSLIKNGTEVSLLVY